MMDLLALWTISRCLRLCVRWEKRDLMGCLHLVCFQSSFDCHDRFEGCHRPELAANSRKCSMVPKQEVFIAQVVDWYIDQPSIVFRIVLIVAATLAQA